MTDFVDTLTEALQAILEEQRQEIEDIRKLTSQIASLRADVLLLNNAVRAIADKDAVL